MADIMQQRRDEILAKKAKLAELKRQRELRAREVSASRQSIGSANDVGSPDYSFHTFKTDLL
jgi:dynein intermediate chain